MPAAAPPMPVPTQADLIALINLLRSIEQGLRAREDPKSAEMFAHHSKLISASLVGMTSKQLQSTFKDISEGLFTYSDQNYRAAMNTIREHGLEPAFTHMVAKKYTRVLSRVLSRGSIRTETEAHAVKNAVDDQVAPGLEASDLERLALLYELYIARG
jgi:hypothetical protein